nr:MAG TPA: hypothetical protein [Crassvirales sp.]
MKLKDKYYSLALCIIYSLSISCITTAIVAYFGLL